MRVAVAGGGKGQRFVRWAKQLGADVIGFYDPEPLVGDKVGERHPDVRRVRSYQELLALQPDVMIIASPQQFHVVQSVAALDAGIHVLSEVTAASSYEEAADLVRAVEHSNAQYMMAENYCFTVPNLIVDAMVKEGLFGKVYRAEGNYIHQGSQLLKTPDGARTWRTFWHAGRNGVTYPTHSLGPILTWMDDRMASVSCMGAGHNFSDEHVIEDAVAIMGHTTKHGLVTTEFDMMSPRPRLSNWYRMQGTLGAYESDRSEFADSGRVSLGGGDWQPLSNFQQFLPADFVSDALVSERIIPDVYMLKKFLDAVESGTPVPIDVYRALDFTLPGLASELSIARGGQPVPVPNPRLPDFVKFSTPNAAERGLDTLS